MRVLRHEQHVVEGQGGGEIGANGREWFGFYIHRLCRGAMTLLVLFSAAARARVVASDLRLVAADGLHRRIVAADTRRLPACAAADPAAAVCPVPADRARPRTRVPVPRSGRSESAASLRATHGRGGNRRRRSRLRSGPAGAATGSGRSPRPPAASWPGTARSSLSCTRRGGRAGRSRAGRCLPSGDRGCRGGLSTADRRSAA